MSLFITNIPAFNEQLGPYHTFFWPHSWIKLILNMNILQGFYLSIIKKTHKHINQCFKSLFLAQS